MRQRLKNPEVVHRGRWAALTVVCTSLMVIGIDNTILNIALPTLSHTQAAGGLGATGSELQWIVDSYTIVFAGLLLTAGSLGDRFGRYRGLTFGLAIFGTGSALSAFASSATMLILTRSLMGVGAAFIMPATLSIITNVFTEPRERAKAIGIWAGITAIGVGAGPVIGGFLLEHFWWGSVFLVNVPVAITGIVLGYFFVPESRDPSAPKLDPLGSVLSIVGLATFLWAIIEGPTHGWGSPEVVGTFVLGLMVLGAFGLWELHTPTPMLDIRFFENPRFSAASGAITITFLTLFGMIFLLTQYLQSVLQYSTVEAGAVLVPMSIVMMVFAPLSPRWVHRFGNKLVVGFGMGSAATALVLMTTLDVNSSTIHVILITLVLGMGVAHIMAPATDSIMGSVPKEKAGVGSAMNDTTRQVGGAIGVALLGSIAASSFSSHMSSQLAGKVPSSLVHAAGDSIGTALDTASRASAATGAKIAEAARTSFVAGFHTAVLVAAVILVMGAVAVLRWLPARAHDHVDAEAEALTEHVPLGIGPVDVVPAELAAVVAEEVELEHELEHERT
jgi:EmrB/QacA subfamily drug resistance transporter